MGVEVIKVLRSLNEAEIEVLTAVWVGTSMGTRLSCYANTHKEGYWWIWGETGDGHDDGEPVYDRPEHTVASSVISLVNKEILTVSKHSDTILKISLDLSSRLLQAQHLAMADKHYQLCLTYRQIAYGGPLIEGGEVGPDMDLTTLPLK